MLFERTFGDNYGKKYGRLLIDTATKTRTDAAKTVSKIVVHKTAEETGDLIEHKIAEKITSVGKSNSKEKGKKDETNEIEEIYIPP